MEMEMEIEMDFHGMKRKELQSHCKKHGIPANLTNREMADRLSSLRKEDVKAVSTDSEIDSVIDTKIIKKVRFSPENETFIFVGSDVDSDSDSASDSDTKKKRVTKRKSKAGKKWTKRKSLEEENPIRVTRSRAQSSRGVIIVEEDSEKRVENVDNFRRVLKSRKNFGTFQDNLVEKRTKLEMVPLKKNEKPSALSLVQDLGTIGYCGRRITRAQTRANGNDSAVANDGECEEASKFELDVDASKQALQEGPLRRIRRSTRLFNLGGQLATHERISPIREDPAIVVEPIRRSTRNASRKVPLETSGKEGETIRQKPVSNEQSSVAAQEPANEKKPVRRSTHNISKRKMVESTELTSREAETKETLQESQISDVRSGVPKDLENKTDPALFKNKEDAENPTGEGKEFSQFDTVLVSALNDEATDAVLNLDSVVKEKESSIVEEDGENAIDKNLETDVDDRSCKLLSSNRESANGKLDEAVECLHKLKNEGSVSSNNSFLPNHQVDSEGECSSPLDIKERPEKEDSMMGKSIGRENDELDDQPVEFDKDNNALQDHQCLVEFNSSGNLDPFQDHLSAGCERQEPVKHAENWSQEAEKLCTVVPRGITKQRVEKSYYGEIVSSHASLPESQDGNEVPDEASNRETTFHMGQCNHANTKEPRTPKLPSIAQEVVHACSEAKLQSGGRILSVIDKDDGQVKEKLHQEDSEGCFHGVFRETYDNEFEKDAVKEEGEPGSLPHFSSGKVQEEKECDAPSASNEIRFAAHEVTNEASYDVTQTVLQIDNPDNLDEENHPEIKLYVDLLRDNLESCSRTDLVKSAEKSSQEAEKLCAVVPHDIKKEAFEESNYGEIASSNTVVLLPATFVHESQDGIEVPDLTTLTRDTSSRKGQCSHGMITETWITKKNETEEAINNELPSAAREVIHECHKRKLQSDGSILWVLEKSGEQVHKKNQEDSHVCFGEVSRETNDEKAGKTSLTMCLDHEFEKDALKEDCEPQSQKVAYEVTQKVLRVEQPKFGELESHEDVADDPNIEDSVGRMDSGLDIKKNLEAEKCDDVTSEVASGNMDYYLGEGEADNTRDGGWRVRVNHANENIKVPKSEDETDALCSHETAALSYDSREACSRIGLELNVSSFLGDENGPHNIGGDKNDATKKEATAKGKGDSVTTNSKSKVCGYNDNLSDATNDLNKENNATISQFAEVLFDDHKDSTEDAAFVSYINFAISNQPLCGNPTEYGSKQTKEALVAHAPEDKFSQSDYIEEAGESSDDVEDADFFFPYPDNKASELQVQSAAALEMDASLRNGEDDGVKKLHELSEEADLESKNGEKDKKGEENLVITEKSSDDVEEAGELSDEEKDADILLPSPDNRVSELQVQSAAIETLQMDVSLGNGEEDDVKKLHVLSKGANLESKNDEKDKEVEENLVMTEKFDQICERRHGEHYTEQSVSQDDVSAIIQEYMEHETHVKFMKNGTSIFENDEGRMIETADIEGYNCEASRDNMLRDSVLHHDEADFAGLYSNEEFPNGVDKHASKSKASDNSVLSDGMMIGSEIDIGRIDGNTISQVVVFHAKTEFNVNEVPNATIDISDNKLANTHENEIVSTEAGDEIVGSRIYSLISPHKFVDDCQWNEKSSADIKLLDDTTFEKESECHADRNSDTKGIGMEMATVKKGILATAMDSAMQGNKEFGTDQIGSGQCRSMLKEACLTDDIHYLGLNNICSSNNENRSKIPKQIGEEVHLQNPENTEISFSASKNFEKGVKSSREKETLELIDELPSFTGLEVKLFSKDGKREEVENMYERNLEDNAISETSKGVKEGVDSVVSTFKVSAEQCCYLDNKMGLEVENEFSVASGDCCHEKDWEANFMESVSTSASPSRKSNSKYLVSATENLDVSFGTSKNTADLKEGFSVLQPEKDVQCSTVSSVTASLRDYMGLKLKEKNALESCDDLPLFTGLELNLLSEDSKRDEIEELHESNLDYKVISETNENSKQLEVLENSQAVASEELHEEKGKLLEKISGSANPTRKNNTEYMVPGTPKSVQKIHTMKENFGTTKRDLVRSITASQRSKRRPLGDLQKN